MFADDAGSAIRCWPQATSAHQLPGVRSSMWRAPPKSQWRLRYHRRPKWLEPVRSTSFSRSPTARSRVRCENSNESIQPCAAPAHADSSCGRSTVGVLSRPSPPKCSGRDSSQRLKRATRPTASSRSCERAAIHGPSSRARRESLRTTAVNAGRACSSDCRADWSKTKPNADAPRCGRPRPEYQSNRFVGSPSALA